MSKTKGTGLREQNLETLDVGKLTPLSPEVISRQATINIGSNFRLSSFCLSFGRYDWSRCSWKIDFGEIYFGRSYRSFQKRIGKEHHDKAWLCQCQNL